LSGIKALGTPEIIILCFLAVLIAVFGKNIRKIGTKGTVLIGVFCALAGALGAAMRSLPGIQPTSFLVIMTGVLLGPGAGLAAGVISALLFDILSVITIYTPWRMLLWGLMGLGGAYIKPKPYLLAPYGFIWGYIFGWVSNSVFIFAGVLPMTWKVFFISCVSSFWFDFSHAMCNAVLLAAFPGFLISLARKNRLYRNTRTPKNKNL
jgi:energy-coupling factor transport system substrate-specific component